MIVETKEEWDVATGTSVRRTSMLFPRFHQWEAVTNIVAAVREEGVGQRYLIEHSAGSGKTNTIAWTAHRLARLHVDDEKVFDSVIVVVDRTVLDGQLQDAIRQIDGSGKIVATISPEDVRKAGAKSKSGLLATGVEERRADHRGDGADLPVRAGRDPGRRRPEGQAVRGHRRRGALLAVRARSPRSSKQVLTAEEVKEIEEGGEVDVESILAAEMTERAESENISYFAFTATPKNKTLELFGRKGPDGKPRRVPPVLDEAGDRGGLHPRRAQGLPVLRHRAEDRRQGRERRRRRGRGGRGPQGADAVGAAAPDQHQPEGADHRRALPRQRRPPAGGQGEGDGRDRLAQGRGEVQEGDRRLHRQARRRGRLVQLPHPGRVLRRGDDGRGRGRGLRTGARSRARTTSSPRPT